MAELFWLLEKAGASTKFLAFGNQREVPVQCLERYGDLMPEIDFDFLSEDKNLDLLER